MFPQRQPIKDYFVMSKSIKLSSGTSVLFVNNDGRLSFSLDGQNSWQADILAVLHYYDRQHPRADELAVPSGISREFGTAGTPSLSAKSSFTLKPCDARRAEMTLEFDAIQITITLHLELEDCGFRVLIPEAGVKEGMPGLFRVLGLEILPEFGAARSGELGYLTLPNWYGCKTYFNKKYPREVRQTIYSSNDQWENNCNAPVFGITRAHGTLCGLIARGDEDAQLVCRQHWEEAQANSVHPQLMYRWSQEDERVAGDREVRYRFAPADCPQGEGYAFVAIQYRKLLRAERGVMTWAEKAKTRPEALDYANRFFLKIFMGYKEPQVDGRGTYHCTTTCHEAREIIQQCLDRGMKKLAVILTGWGQDGHDGQPPRYFPVDERVGGTGKMRELVAWAKAHDIMLGVHTCFTDIYECSPEFRLEDVIRHRSGDPWAGVIWGGGRAHRPCPTAILPHVKRDMAELAALGFHGHHHFDAIGGFKLCYSEKHPLTTRSAFMEAVRENCRATITTLGSLSTEMPFGQYFNVMDGFFHSHSHLANFLRGRPIARYFFDEMVPLLGIALHGSHNCGTLPWLKAKPGDLELHLGEMLGSALKPSAEVCRRPSPHFGIPTYAGKEEMLARTYAFFYGAEGVLSKLNGGDIEGRWEMAPGVSRTRYGNGTEVTVNLGTEPYAGISPIGISWTTGGVSEGWH
jgi:hypothetical protein